MLTEETPHEMEMELIFERKEQFEHLAKQLNSTEVRQILPLVDIMRYKLSNCTDDFNSLRALSLLLNDINKLMKRMLKNRSIKTKLWLMYHSK